jgi:hypothetical protein
MISTYLRPLDEVDAKRNDRHVDKAQSRSCRSSLSMTA